jgi:hypothetical protein
VSEEKPPLADALRLLAEKERSLLTEHPSPTELETYHAGKLSSAAEDRIREHLAVCRDCGDLLLDIAGVAELKPPPGIPELTDDEVEADWLALQIRMKWAAAAEKQGPAPVVPIRPAPPPKPAPWAPRLAAAASIVAVLGIILALYQSGRVGELERQLQKFEQPRSVPTRHLDSGVRRSQSKEEADRPLSSHAEAILFLYPDTERVYPRYEAEIAGGTMSVAPPPSPDEPVSLLIPPGFLQPGDLQIVLFGVDGSRRDKVGTYSLQVHGP